MHLPKTGPLRCPGCHRSSLSVRHRLLVAIRAKARCPACGVAIRFGLLPRIVHTVFGDAVLLAGVVGALVWQAPVLRSAASGTWLTLALLLPIQPDPSESAPQH